jgi:hypothetical protein
MSNTPEIAPEEATKFSQVNASLNVLSLGTVESILSQAYGYMLRFAKRPTRSQFEKIFEAIETTLQVQENHIASKDSEIAGLHAEIAKLYEHISMISSGHQGNNNRTGPTREVFRGLNGVCRSRS